MLAHVFFLDSLNSSGQVVFQEWEYRYILMKEGEDLSLWLLTCSFQPLKLFFIRSVTFETGHLHLEEPNSVLNTGD